MPVKRAGTVSPCPAGTFTVNEVQGSADSIPGILEPIRVREVVQAGDVFLFHFACPACGVDLFQGFPCTYCSECFKDLAPFGFLVPKLRSKTRLLAGTRRKPRVGRKFVGLLWKDQDGRCAYCSEQLEKYDVEHVTPVSVGGTKCNHLAGSCVFADLNGKRAFILARRESKKGAL